VPYLTHDVDKDSPTGFIGMPIGLGTQLCAQCIVQGFEQGRYGLQPTGQGAWRHVQAVIGQVLQQTLAGSAIGKLVQQHTDPHRNTKLAPVDESCRTGRCDDTADTSTLASWRIAVAVNNAPIGLDLDLQHLKVVGAGKLFEGQPALRTLRLLQNNILVARIQVGFNGASVADHAALLSALAARHCFGATLAGSALLALGREETLLQITHLRQCRVQRALQRSI